MKERKIIEFNPAELLNNVANNLDVSQFESIDESQFKKAPNILDFTIDPEFLNATMLPKQIQMGLKLFAEYCPVCTDMDFFENLFDQDIGTIKEKVVRLEHGKCPKCEATRWELMQRGLLNDYNEFAGCLGQRCIPFDSMVNTNRGIISMSDVEVGDIVPNGYVLKKLDSGKLKVKKLRTEIEMVLSGSADSHIVPILNDDNVIINKKISDVEVGDMVLIVSPSLYPSLNYRVYNKYTKWPSTFDITLSAFLGLLCRRFKISEDFKQIVFTNSNIDVLSEMFSKIIDIPFKKSDNNIIVDDQEFIDWFKIITNFKQIPDGIMQSTEESVSVFVNNFLSNDWYDDILRIPKSEIQDLKSLQLLLLNMNLLTMPIGEELCNICLETDNEYHNKLMDIGYYPTKVTEIIDTDEEIQMFDIVVPNSNVYVGDGFLQHNSGKSKFIGIIANYVLHRFLCMSNPIRMFNQSAGDILNISFAGLNEDKVEKNLWGPFIGFMDASPWFQKYHSFLDEKSKELKKPLMAKRTTFVEYFHKKILIDFYGSHGDTMRGDTRIFASADEIAFMGSGSESKGSTVMNADAIYTSLNNSLATMRMKRRQIFNEKNYDIPPILIANISSPSSTKDKIMKQVKASNTNPAIYGVHAATWHCVTGDTIITCKEGDFRIDSDFETIDGRKFKKAIFENQHVHDLITKRGLRLSCTLDHKIATYNGIFKTWEYIHPKIGNVIYTFYGWDTVEAFENERIADVYDISFEGDSHLYYTNKIVSHNCNPDYTEDALLQEYASEDPAEFYRNFGAQPPIESNPFLSEMSSIDRIAVGQTNNFYSFSIEKSKDALGDNFVFGKLVINNKDQSPRLLAFDLGSTKNAFGLCIFKLDQDARIVLEDGLIIKPSKEYKINLPWIYNNITVPLIENYNVKHVLFDKWQSLDQVTRIRDLGINAQVYSLKYDNMDDIRGMIRNRSIIIPRLSKAMSEYRKDWEKDDDIIFSEITAQLGIQLLTVRDLGNRMIKPAHGDDDLFRAFCLGAYSLTNTKIIESMKQTTNSQPVAQGPVGVVKSLSGSSVTTSSSGIGVFVSRGRR